MRSRLFMCLIAAYLYYQVIAGGNLFSSEMMLDSNATLESKTVLSIMKKITVVIVKATLKITDAEITAECWVVGSATNCSCSVGYTWSNDVCYNHSCCSDTECKENVSNFTQLCIKKIEVRINGSVTSKEDGIEQELRGAFGKLNGYQSLNVTSSSADSALFEAAVSVKFTTSKLQEVVTKLEKDITGATVLLDTLGLVTIESPNTTVCYKSDPKLKCLFDEATDSAAWTFNSLKNERFERFELKEGSVVKLHPPCSNPENSSCVEIELQGVTGIWSGTYVCGFTNGSIRHTAKTELKVALLPEDISLTIDPLTADCSIKPSPTKVSIVVTATILNTVQSTEKYDVSWTFNGAHSSKGTSEGNLLYTFKVDVPCEKNHKPQSVDITFTNTMLQTKSASVKIPVIYGGDTFCKGESVSGDNWPNTPSGDTVLFRTCAKGTTGYKSRTCDGTSWKKVLFFCVNKKLNEILNAADDFQKGLGATQEVAKNIFARLLNSSTTYSSPESQNNAADITASINILSFMASASETIELTEGVLDTFVGAASNMLNQTWDSNGDDTSIHDMSANYLQSVEGLVKNIKINTSTGLQTPNLELKFCSSRECNVTVFGIGVNLNKTNGTMKTVAVKNLMQKLKNGFLNTERTDLLISATLDNNGSSVEIEMAFPIEQQDSVTPLCVFWNTTTRDWSEEGCVVKIGHGNGTVCKCNHLTSFSVLMSKSGVSDPALDMITNVGLGVSIFSLLILLIVEYLVWSAVVKSNLSLFRHTALVNISVFILLADCSFLASTSPEDLSGTWCLVLTICKHLFYLAAFSWMMCLSIMLMHQLIFVFSPLRKKVFMFLSSILGYVCPLLIVGCSYIYCEYMKTDYYDDKTCWLVYDSVLRGSMHAFILPVGTVILTNLFAMIVVILTLVKSSVPDQSKADDKETAKSIIKVVVFLTPVFGVTWIFGFALFIVKHGTTMYTVAEYSFTILNSFQGLFLLLTGCIAEQKVREEMIKIIMAKSGRSESTKNLTTTSFTKDK